MSTETTAMLSVKPGASRSPRIKAGPAAFTGRVVVWFILIGFAVVSLVPMIWLILAPSKRPEQLHSMNPFAFGSFENYATAWNNLMTFGEHGNQVLIWAWNSVWYTSTIVAISSITAILAGYALATAPMPFKKQILITTLIAMIVPPVALVLPLFLEISAMGLTDTPWAIILTGSFYPFGAFLAYIYFSTSIPFELYEAAKIDGCGEFKTFFKIALPLSKGLLGMLAFFAFTAAWMNYFLPVVVVPGNSDVAPLPVGLGILFSATPAINPAIGATVLPIHQPEIALAGLIVALPVLIVFLASSKLLVRGVLAGSVKS